MAVHQCARFRNNPRLVHECAVRCIAKYLTSTSKYVDLLDGNPQLSTCGVVYNPDKEKSIECYVDAEFAGGCAQADADIAENSMSRTGYVIAYAICTVL